jgi:trk system potassium uptake protein TrkH
VRYRPAALTVLTFMVAIVVGGITLNASSVGLTARASQPLSSMFTAVSAVCVTGLSVVDLASEFDTRGQLIVLALIQIGGIGVLTLSNWLLLSLRGRLGLYGSLMTRRAMGSVLKVPPSLILRRVLLFTIIGEGAGALVLFLRFSADFSPQQAGWLAVFHSVSAFCNAGFSLFPDSLVRYREDVVVNFTVMSLIFFGGLGYVAAADLAEQFAARIRGVPRKLALHSRIVLSTSCLMVAVGFGVFLAFEWGNTFATESMGGEFVQSLFLSVTARTAGFNTVETGHLTNMSLVMLIVLMIIGASPGSTGGGIKTTSAAILWALVKAQLTSRSKPEIAGRSISHDLVGKAVALIILYVLIATLGMIALQATEFGEQPHDQTRGVFLEHFFEVISALSTVGLTTGVTARLSDEGLVVLMVLMFVGRVGPLVLASSLIGERKSLGYSLPEGDIIIG